MTFGEDTQGREEQKAPLGDKVTGSAGDAEPYGEKGDLGDTAVLGLRRIAVVKSDEGQSAEEVVVPDFLANPKSSTGRNRRVQESDVEEQGPQKHYDPAPDVAEEEVEEEAPADELTGPMFVDTQEPTSHETDDSGLDVLVDEYDWEWGAGGFEGPESWYADTPPEDTRGTVSPLANLPVIGAHDAPAATPHAVGDEHDPWPDRLMWPEETLEDRPEESREGRQEAASPAEHGPESGAQGSKEGQQVIGADEGEVAVEEAGKGKGRSRLKRVLLIILALCVVCGVAVGIHVLGMRQFEGRFQMRTTINGLDVSGCTPADAIARLEEETEAYMCTVGVGDYAGAFRGVDFALARDEERMVQMAWEQVDLNKWELSAILGCTYEVDPGLTFDEPVLRDVVMHSVDDHNTMALPSDGAWIRLDEASGLYELGGETSGTAVAKEPVADAVVADVSAFHTTSNPDPEASLHEATVNDIPPYAYAVVRANLDRSNDIEILVAGEPVATATSEQLRQWVTIDETPAVVVDTQALYDWGEAVVEDAVWHRDDWSNYYLDLDGFVAGFAERLSLGIVDGYEAPTVVALRTEGESRELAYSRGGWNSELGRYIDVDLEAQFVRLFDETGNVIWESACVSGDLYESHSTVTGVFEIYAKQMGATLVGLDYNNDGKPDYESYVNFWMPFYGGYGLHDATWRSSFGGDFFYYDGSHGCINLPYAKAEELYNITFVGEKVNVHW